MLFNIADADGNGALSFSEYSNLFKAVVKAALPANKFSSLNLTSNSSAAASTTAASTTPASTAAAAPATTPATAASATPAPATAGKTVASPTVSKGGLYILNALNELVI